MEIKIVREKNNSNSITGKMYVNDKFVGYTLERPFKGNKENISSFYAGEYKAFERMDPGPKNNSKYRGNWRVQLKEVDGRTNIQIHIGNKPKDSEGCILLGTTVDQKNNKIGSSEKAYKNFKKIFKSELKEGEEINVSVQDKTEEKPTVKKEDKKKEPEKKAEKKKKDEEEEKKKGISMSGGCGMDPPAREEKKKESVMEMIERVLNAPPPKDKRCGSTGKPREPEGNAPLPPPEEPTTCGLGPSVIKREVFGSIMDIMRIKNIKPEDKTCGSTGRIPQMQPNIFSEFDAKRRVSDRMKEHMETEKGFDPGKGFF